MTVLARPRATGTVPHGPCGPGARHNSSCASRQPADRAGPGASWISKACATRSCWTAAASCVRAGSSQEAAATDLAARRVDRRRFNCHLQQGLSAAATAACTAGSFAARPRSGTAGCRLAPWSDTRRARAQRTGHAPCSNDRPVRGVPVRAPGHRHRQVQRSVRSGAGLRAPQSRALDAGRWRPGPTLVGTRGVRKAVTDHPLTRASAGRIRFARWILRAANISSSSRQQAAVRHQV